MSQPPAIGKEIQQLQKAIRAIQIDTPAFPQLDELRKEAASLQRLQIDTRFLGDLRSLRQSIERAQPTDHGKELLNATENMKALRNKIARFQPPTEQRSANRPAYSLDEEDDDA